MVASGVVGGGEDGDNSTTASEKLGEVERGDYVALCQEREEKKVRSGSHGSVGVDGEGTGNSTIGFLY